MTGSADRGRGTRRVLRLAGLGLGLIALPALAQSGAPTPLFPQTPPPDETAPQATEPPTALPEPGSGAAPAARRAPSGVMVEELAAPDPDLAGTLRAENGGLPADLWAGTSRLEVEALLAEIPSGITSPAMRDLTHRLLLTVADAPPGEGSGRGLAALRLEALIRSGDPAGAAALLDRTGRPLEDEAAALAWVEMAYLTGDMERACRTLPDLLGRFNRPGFEKWQIVCQVRAGNADQALLGIDLLREQGEKDDIFFRLTEAAAAGQKAPVKGVATPTPVQLALMLAAGRQPPADLKVSEAASLAALARSELVPLPQRLAAGERAAALGTLDGAGLAALYAAVPAADPKALTAAAAAKPTPQLRAQFLQALKAEPAPAARAGLFKGAMLAASTPQQAGPYGGLLLDGTTDFRLNVGFAVVAPLLARLQLLHGQVDVAKPWLELARDDFNANKDEGAFARLWPLAAAQGLVREAEFDKTRWVRDLGGDAARDRADQALILLSALEAPVAPLPPHADGSPAAKSKGAVLIEALALLGPEGPAGADALGLADILTGLRRAGLEAEARRLAVEALAQILRPGS